MKRRPEAQEAASLLGRPRALLPEPELVPQGLFYSCLVALGGLGALGCVLTAFQIPVQALILFGVGACCCLTFGLAAMNRKAWVIVSLAALVLWALWAWRQWENLEQGFAISANLVLQAYGDKLGISLPQLPNPIHPNRQAQIATLLWVGVEVPFFWLLTFLWARRKSALSAFCLTGLFLLSHMAISLLPAAWTLGALLLFWCVLLLTAGSLGQRHKLLDEQGTYRLAGTAAARPFTLLLLPLLALCMVGLYHLFPEDTYQRPQLVTGLREDLSDGLGLEGPLPGDGNGGNSRMDLSALGSRHYTGETALRVKYDWEGDRDQSAAQNLEKDYLKSFVGSVYTGHSWERLDSAAARELEAVAGELEVQSLLVRYQELGGSQNRYASDISYSLSVENVGASSRLAFLPYGPLGGDQWGEQGLALVEDGFAQSSRWLLGTDRYQLSCLGLPQGVSYYERAVSLPVDLYAAYCAAQGREVPEHLTPEEDMAASLELSDALRGDPAAQPQAWTETGQFLPDRWRIPDWALSAYEAYDPEAAAFLQSVEAYSDFVYRYYTQLPAGLEDFLHQFRLEHGLDPTGYSDPIAAMEEGLHRLYDQGYTYTLSPQSPPEGEDFVTWFLTEGREGYCVHFATAAVALFRSAGIPARYAEGYAVPSGYDGLWVDVPDYNAHAWVEVYTGGTGWLPVEVTPAGPEAPAAYLNAQYPTTEASPTPEPAASPTPAPTPAATAGPSAGPAVSPSASPAAGDGGGGSWDFPWQPVLGVLLALAGAALALWANRAIRRQARRRAFAQRDRNKAALAAYAHLLRLWALAEPGSAPPQEWEDLALKARFSSHTLTREELGVLTGAAAGLEGRLGRELPAKQRLYRQYLQGLL